MGEVAWVGRGSLGRDDGRVVLVRPGRELLRPGPASAAGSASSSRPAARPDDDGDRPAGTRHDRIREHLAARGASFYRDLFVAAGGGSDREVLDAVWDLVWAGEVTNDTFGPLRALRWKRSAREARRRPGRLTSFGPPEGAGRWSLVEPTTGTPTERTHALALALLERQGIVTRDGVAGESVEGGFSGVYPVLRALEEAGRIRRGYFIDGLGAAQFAQPGAIERLRTVRDAARSRDEQAVYVLAAADPASPFGAAIPWPRRDDGDRRPLQRAAGAYVVVVDGSAALYLERGGGTLQVLAPGDEPDVGRAAADALHTLVDDGRFRELVIAKVDGEPAQTSPFRDRLVDAGFVPGYRGLALRRRAPAASGDARPWNGGRGGAGRDRAGAGRDRPGVASSRGFGPF
ncbi:MAG TPA: hypothetical protein VFP22_11650, partial [Candidatus Limnocylindrales bacterium]|nr:hypothetical protein [Candidatus Limnocylindrales bacterium]